MKQCLTIFTSNKLTGLISVTLAVLLMSNVELIEGSPMVTVDSEILKQFEQTNCKIVPVIIICHDECEPIVTALKRAGIKVSSTESSILGSIGAEITADQVEIIKDLSGISAIEYDQEVNAL